MSITSKMVRDDLFKGEAWAVKNPEFTERLADALEVLEFIESGGAVCFANDDSPDAGLFQANDSYGDDSYGDSPIAAVRAATKGT